MSSRCLKTWSYTVPVLLGKGSIRPQFNVSLIKRAIYQMWHKFLKKKKVVQNIWATFVNACKYALIAYLLYLAFVTEKTSFTSALLNLWSATGKVTWTRFFLPPQVVYPYWHFLWSHIHSTTFKQWKGQNKNKHSKIFQKGYIQVPLVLACLDGLLGSPVPIALLARTRNSYSTQGLRSITVAVNWRPPIASGTGKTHNIS